MGLISKHCVEASSTSDPNILSPTLIGWVGLIIVMRFSSFG